MSSQADRRTRILALVLKGSETPLERRAYEQLTDLYLDIKHAGGALWRYVHNVLRAAESLDRDLVTPPPRAPAKTK